MKTEVIHLWPGREDVRLTALYASPTPGFGGKLNPRPAVIVCPGGGYLFCSSEGNEGDLLAAGFYAAGYQAFVLEYTVASSCGGNPTTYPYPLYDLAKAFLTIHDNASRWGVDTEKISICGFSAGGHLCASYAVHWQDAFLSEKMGADSRLLRPQAAILGYPLLDTEIIFAPEHIKDLKDPMMEHQVCMAMFGTKAPTPDQLYASTAWHHLSSHTPPIFIAHAMDDTTVAVSQSIEFVRKCVEKNVPCEFHMYECGGHGFGAGLSMAEPYKKDQAKEISSWIDLAITWLWHQNAPETKKELTMFFDAPGPEMPC